MSYGFDYDPERDRIFATVDSLKITGNVVPVHWAREFSRRSSHSKAALVAPYILAEITYWYRLIESRDEYGNVEYRRRFDGDLLLPYSYFEKQLGQSARLIREAIAFLRDDIGVIEVEVIKSLYLEQYARAFGNVLSIRLVPEKLSELILPVGRTRVLEGLVNGTYYKDGKPVREGRVSERPTQSPRPTRERAQQAKKAAQASQQERPTQSPRPTRERAQQAKKAAQAAQQERPTQSPRPTRVEERDVTEYVPSARSAELTRAEQAIDERYSDKQATAVVWAYWGAHEGRTLGMPNEYAPEDFRQNWLIPAKSLLALAGGDAGEAAALAGRACVRATTTKNREGQFYKVFSLRSLIAWAKAIAEEERAVDQTDGQSDDYSGYLIL